MKTLRWLVCAMVLWFGARGLSADSFFKVPDFKPTVLRPENGPDFVGAVKIEGKNDRPLSDMKKAWVWTGAYELASTLTTDPDSNTDPTRFDLQFHLRGDLDSDSAAPEFPGAAGRNTDVTPSGGKKKWQRGSVVTGLAAAFEGDQRMDNRQFASGIRLAYVPSDSRDQRLQWWTPMLSLEYRRVHEMGSKLAEKLGLPEQDYWRASFIAAWQIDLTDAFGLSGVNGVSVIPAFQYHRSTDLTLPAGDFGDAYHVSLAVQWDVPEGRPVARWLRTASIQISDGRLPPALKSQTTVAVVLTVNWDNLLD